MAEAEVVEVEWRVELALVTMVVAAVAAEAVEAAANQWPNETFCFYCACGKRTER